MQEQVQGQPFLGGVAATWLYLQRGMFSQGVSALPRALWQRMFLAAWYLYCLVVSAAYTCNFIAIFTSPAYPQRITTLQQLADSDYRLAMEDNGAYVMDVLSKAEYPVFQRLWAKVDFFQREEDLVAAMVAGSHAIVDVITPQSIILGGQYKISQDVRDTKYLQLSNVYNWYVVREKFQPGYLSWFFSKHTPWKHKFDRSIERLVESGVFKHWLKVETENVLGRNWEQQQQGQGEQLNKALTLQDLQGVFYILLLGWVVGVALFLQELLRHYCLQH
ncbi:Ionotropic receptor 21a-like 7 [Homarus americanus]|uniref:Ionotropic receptor 21a-like 7 n=1 Tax=Homarus americanus TaxID=6706 RepID=A0A8J5T9E2_HOMAM|nr:Ionotropic receptor 21a-like 7 [Homarus americanus]